MMPKEELPREEGGAEYRQNEQLSFPASESLFRIRKKQWEMACALRDHSMVVGCFKVSWQVEFISY